MINGRTAKTLNKIVEIYERDEVPTPYSVSRGLGFHVTGAISHALTKLEREGLIRRIPHSNSFVEILPLDPAFDLEMWEGEMA